MDKNGETRSTVPAVKNSGGRKSLLLISPDSYDATRAKGTLSQWLEYDCGGYFDTVVMWRFNLPEDKEIDLSRRIRIIETGRKFHIKFLDLFYYIFTGIRLIRKYRFNVIRATEPFYRGCMGWILARLFNTPFCISVHADYDKRSDLTGADSDFMILGSRKIAKSIENFILRRAERIMVIREHLKKKYIREGMDKGKIRVIPHGLDLDAFIRQADVDVHQAYDIPGQKRILGFAGRISKENYVHDVLRIAAALQKKSPETFMILVAGDGPEVEHCRNRIKNEGLEAAVRMIGSQPQNVISSLRQSSFVNLCLMGGYSLIEACASGRPVIAYDVEWHYELVIDGQTGYRVPEGNVEEVVRKIIQLAGDSKLAGEMGRAARERAFARHSLEASLETKIACYGELVTKKSGGIS